MLFKILPVSLINNSESVLLLNSSQFDHSCHEFNGVSISGGTKKDAFKETINQDAFRVYTFPSGKIRVVVCDGLGAYRKSQIASTNITESLNFDFDLSQKEILYPILNQAIQTFPPKEAATCMLIADFVPSVDGSGYHAFFVNSGDSKAIIYNTDSVVFSTQEHSIPKEQGLVGLADQFHSKRQIVTKCLDLNLENREKNISDDLFDSYDFYLEKGKNLSCLIASDGFWDNILPDQVPVFGAGLAIHEQLLKFEFIIKSWVNFGYFNSKPYAEKIFSHDINVIQFIQFLDSSKDNHLSNSNFDSYRSICEYFTIKDSSSLQEFMNQCTSFDAILKEHQHFDWTLKNDDGDISESMILSFKLFCFRLNILQKSSDDNIIDVLETYKNSCMSFYTNKSNCFVDIVENALIEHIIIFGSIPFDLSTNFDSKIYDMKMLDKSDDLTIVGLNF
tara:strand:- start:584 stop:1927 length:1344 start_codon:yes stop_codon:yes gene_type:complete